MKVEYRPAPVPPPPPQEVVLTCSEKEAEIILTALDYMSHYTVRTEVGVLANILRQVLACPSRH